MGSASNKNHVSSAVLRKKKDTATLNLNRCTGKTSRVGEKREMYRSLQRKDKEIQVDYHLKFIPKRGRVTSVLVCFLGHIK